MRNKNIKIIHTSPGVSVSFYHDFSKQKTAERTAV